MKNYQGILLILCAIWTIVGQIVADYAANPSVGNFCEYSSYATGLIFVGVLVYKYLNSGRSSK